MKIVNQSPEEISAKKLKRQAYNKAWRESNRAHVSSYQKAYRKSLKEADPDYHKKLHATRKEADPDRWSRMHKISNAKWYKANPNYNKIHGKQQRKANPNFNKDYYHANKTERLNYNKTYVSERCRTDESFKVKLKLRNLVSHAFKRIKRSKPARTEELLGCTCEEAKAHIESLWTPGMSWDNHSVHGWHIDHIRPVADFKEDELHLMNHISNLQPLWAKDNYTKSDKC